MLKMMHKEKNLHNLLWLLKQGVILELKETNRSNTQPETEYHFLLTCPIYRKNRNVCSINFAILCLQKTRETRGKNIAHNLVL